MRLLIAAAIFACGCTSIPPPEPPAFPSQTEFGPEQTFTGRLVMSFERQSFDGCWLNFGAGALGQLAALAPSPALASQSGHYSANVTLVGQRRGMLNVGSQGPMPYGYGHMGAYECEIKARRIVSARLSD